LNSAAAALKEIARMGFASYLENITDRYYESSPLTDWLEYLGPTAQRRDVEEARFLFGDPLERPRRLIRDFWSYYRHQQPADGFPSGKWEGHFRNIKALHGILAPVSKLPKQHMHAWLQVKEIETRLRTFFQDANVYGPLSRSVFQRVFNISKAIDARCTALVRELNQFNKTVRTMPVEDRGKAEIEDAVRQLNEIKDRLSRDLRELEQNQALAKEGHQLWDSFLRGRLHNPFRHWLS
jgi:hypothetical protein